MATVSTGDPDNVQTDQYGGNVYEFLNVPPLPVVNVTAGQGGTWVAPNTIYSTVVTAVGGGCGGSGVVNVTPGNHYGYATGGNGYASGGVVYGPGGPYIQPQPVLPDPAIWGATIRDPWNIDDGTVKLNKQTLTQSDVAKIVDEITTRVGPNETVIVCVDDTTTATQMSELARNMKDHAQINGIVMTRALHIVKCTGRPTTEDERVDVLARLAVVWEANPNMKLGELISKVVGTGMLKDVDDYALIRAMEISGMEKK